MLAAFIVVFREVFVAGLIIGIALSAARGVAGAKFWIGSGVIAGACAATLVALFLQTLSSAFEGTGQDVLNGGILATAVLMLLSHNAMMAKQGALIAVEMQSIGAAIRASKATLASLAIVVGIAVLREGSEVALFLSGIAATERDLGMAMVIGSLAGLAAGALIVALAYFGLLRIPPRHVFLVTSGLIAFLAAGMAAQSLGFFEQAGLLALRDPLWDTSDILSDTSIAGRAVHTLLGYVAQPTWPQVALWITVMTVNALMIWRGLGFKPVRRLG